MNLSCGNRNCYNNSGNQENKLKTCSGCGSISYCSKDCQRIDWKDHKKICGRKKINTEPNLILRPLDVMNDNRQTILSELVGCFDFEKLSPIINFLLTVSGLSDRKTAGSLIITISEKTEDFGLILLENFSKFHDFPHPENGENLWKMVDIFGKDPSIKSQTIFNRFTFSIRAERLLGKDEKYSPYDEMKILPEFRHLVNVLEYEEGFEYVSNFLKIDPAVVLGLLRTDVPGYEALRNKAIKKLSKFNVGADHAEFSKTFTIRVVYKYVQLMPASVKNTSSYHTQSIILPVEYMI